MFIQILENSNFITIVPASVIFLLVLIAFKKSKTSKKTNHENTDDRIFSYKPEPMIDYSKIDTNSALEIPVPDESDPDCLNLVKVNYLGLLDDKQLRKEAESCINKYGVGSCGPRGFYGTIDIHLTLESRLAEFMGMQESVLYSYGFSTISSAIGAYCKKSDIIFSDEKISFCSNQGMLAAKSTVVYFKHNDLHDLEIKLKEYEKKENQRKRLYRKFLIVEGIYAATGTICPLPKLMELRQKYKLRIFIDESLSFGVLGKTGQGVTEHLNVDRSDVDMIMASLEGAVGSIGGFCVGASVVIEHQRLSGLGYCFSASLPPFLSHTAICALDRFKKNPAMFEELRTICVKVDEQLKTLKKYTVISDPLSPLKVITLQNMENRFDNIKSVHSICSEKKLHLMCSDECLRFNISVALTDADIGKIILILEEAAKEF